jgi:hypothetical protein
MGPGGWCSDAVIVLLSDRCVFVTRGRGATFSLMGMQEIVENISGMFEGGRYARTEEELYEKAIALLDKCKIERPGTDREESGSEADVDDT